MDEQKYNLEQSLTELDKLFDLSAKDTDKTACEALAEKARIIYEQYPESEDIAVRYAKTLFYLSTKQIVLKELETTAKKLEKLQQKFPESNDIAEALAGTLLLLSFEQTVLRELETTAEKLEKLQQEFPKSNDIALHYARFLFILSDKQTVLKELEATVEKLQGLQQKFPESHDIAEAFAKTLLLLSIKQTMLKELESTAEKLEKLQQKFPESHDIAGAFARTLLLLSFEQTVLNELETTAEKLQELQQKFLESPVIALQYARFSFVLLIKQTELKKIEDTVEKLEKLQQKFPKSEEIAFIYSILLASLFNHQTELDERLQTTKIIKKLYEQFSKFMLQNFDDLFFRDDNVCYREEYKLFNFILKEGLLKNTKYAILQTWAERYKENSSEIKNLLSIYQLVQKIKYQLGLKDEDKNQMLKFGHYTKGSTLQIMLNQEGNDKKDFSVSGKTRLYNANYMNDPEEGIVIEQILGLDRRDVLEPSSWFLMSFTNKTDDLAMWSQYGDDAKGVCLVLREDDFSRFTSFNDVSWRQEKNFLEFSDKMYLLKSELNSGFEKSIFRSESENSVDTVNDEGTEPNSVEKDSDSKGNSDYLYRIAYVKHTEENLKLERTELFEKSEIEELEKLLNSLKEKLDIGSKITEKNYQDAISECIEEIRYLFKSVDYKYENELRILRYANLDPSNKEIKIDKSSGVGKLYIERKNSIQIGEVIFGPKFPNPEYVTPLLKLLDENIDYKKSTIKFR